MTTHPLFPRIGPFTWLVLQATSVVASILLAFAIDAWWAQRTETAEKNASLVAVKEGLLETRVWVSEDRIYRKATRDSAKAVLQAIAAGHYEDNEKTLDHRLGDFLWFSGAPEVGGAFQSFLLSGHLTAVKNEKLRRVLAAWPDYVRSYAKLTAQDYETYSEAVAPFLAKKAALAQISNESYLYGMPGHGWSADPEAMVPIAGQHSQPDAIIRPRADATSHPVKPRWSAPTTRLRFPVDHAFASTRRAPSEIASLAATGTRAAAHGGAHGRRPGAPHAATPGPTRPPPARAASERQAPVGPARWWRKTENLET